MRFWTIAVICFISLLFFSDIASTDSPDIYEEDEIFVSQDIYEEDDIFEQASAITLNDEIQQHNFHDALDEDWVKFRGIENGTYTIQVNSTGSNSNVIIELYEYALWGNKVIDYLDTTTQNTSADASLTWVASQYGVYHIRTRHHDPEAYGKNTAYKLRVEGPSSPLRPDEDDGFSSPDIYENDNTYDQANVIIPNDETQQRNFHDVWDEDWVMFKGIQGKTYNIEFSSLNANCNAIIEFYDTDMTPLGYTDTAYEEEWSAKMDCWPWIFCQEDSVYYIRIQQRYDLKGCGGDGSYQLKVNTFCPDFYEEDDIFEQANDIMPCRGHYGHNFHDAGDADWMKFQGTRGEVYVIEVKNQGANCDAVIALYDTDGVTRLASQDGADVLGDTSLTWQAPANGIYYVKVRHQNPNAYGEDTEYEIIVNGVFCPDVYEDDDEFFMARGIKLYDIPQKHNFHDAGDEDWNRFYGRGGERYRIEAGNLGVNCDVVIELYTYDDPGERLIASQDAAGISENETLTWVASENEVYYIKVRHRDPEIYGENTEYEINLNTFCPDDNDFCPDAYEEDDTSDLALDIPPHGIVNQRHNFHDPGDEDWIRFDGRSETTYFIDIHSLLEEGNIVIELYEADGVTLLAAQDTQGVGKSSMEWFSPENAPYYVRIRHHDPEAYGESTAYELMMYSFPDIYEQDDSFEQAVAIMPSPPESDGIWISDMPELSYNFDSPGDEDWIKFEVASGEAYTIAAVDLGENADVVIEIYAPDRSLLVSQNVAGGAADESLTWTPPEDGVYYVKTRNEDPEAYGRDTEYNLNLGRSNKVASDAFPGYVEGIVTDDFSNMPIEGAAIKTSGNFYTSSLSKGGYRMSHPAGVHTITAEASGYETFTDSLIVGEIETTTKHIRMIPITGTAATPTLSPAPGIHFLEQHIDIESETFGTTIRYTTDGSEPTELSPAYVESVSVPATTTIRARAYKNNWTASEIVTGIYEITGKVETPTFSPEPGTYTVGPNVELLCVTPDAFIHYTTDGSEPGEDSLIYTASIPVSSSMTIKAKAFKKDWISSGTATGSYTITGTVASPTFSPDPGTYPTARNVELSCATDGAVIRFTTDGTGPAENSPAYAAPISVTSSMTIRAKAFKKDWISSGTTTGAYTITGTVASPTFSPDPGTYPSARNVELSCTTNGAVIRYTTDGSAPSANSSRYSSAISLAASTIIKAKAYKTGWTASITATGIYTITGTAEAPIFSPLPAAYATPQYIELSTISSGASVYYTTDGSEPTERSRIYTTPIPVTSDMTVRAKAFKTDWAPSVTATGVYTITQTVEAPSFAPSPGIYVIAQEVELSCATSDAVIHYTTDGSEPGEDSPLYLSPIVISETTTIKAKAFKTDWNASTVTAGEYIITGTVKTPTFSVPSEIYEEVQEIELISATPGAAIHYTTDGSEPTEDSQIYQSPITVSATMTIKAKAFKTDWNPSATETGNYIITIIESPDSGGGACFLNTALER